MSDIIQLLPDHVANQIAAGEVVQRPASVIKELLENAIDAYAHNIQVVVKDAGKTLIQIVDDGAGMSLTDARMCFERHATSKIKSAEDLFSLNTKGFRGEALASIAAIAHVELKTKPQNEEVGTCIKIEGSKVTSQEPCVTPKGTSLCVKNLFYNIPARRNFLKSDAVELRHIIDEFQRVAMAHPSIAFSLFHNGGELFQLPSTNHRQRITNIFGAKTNEKLVPVNEDTEIVKISGFVGKPEFAKRSRGEQFFFVNNRFIKSPYLNHAVSAAFDGLLKEKTYPSYFLYLDVNPKSIDINIHPTKTEIKFDDEHALYAMLRSAIKHSLGQFSVAPVLDFDRDANLDTPYEYKNRQAQVPKIEVDRSFNPFENELNTSSIRSGKSHNFRKENTQSWESLYAGLKTTPETNQHQFKQVEFESEEVTGKLFDDNHSGSEAGTFQLQKKYIVSTLKSGILVIDQNRAHTRILYEELLKNITIAAAVSQQLLFPLQLQFNTHEIEMLKEIKESLEQTGFIFSNIEDETVEITGIPTLISESEVGILLEQLLSDFENEVPDNGFSQTDLLAKSLAKGMAVKSGTLLNSTEQQHIVNRLFACKEPDVSPFNKSVFVTLTVDELDKKFT
ncbi:DNA mismatch repair endonuclease MutL [Zunongwangia profunda]|uniref:DNA mismatch repair protein MutL n=2 Tax=Zunongwangia profunda TaxID=398743 RepID=D5BKB4_ZUNPS|nr:DNA mismatch repair endonuclease MutL [Zunongwangia profunda]ADF51794.1 DNA mismatch repair protein MutL [Zunongwangia profunda SM-A87]MAS71340.1 DNA mismatch repair protein MutL [Zunongwangia sp.]HAJ81427.1 DNA mismatch repair endonuclease MutL [Zunongwangia profunda]HCV82990.1 DNA mismatch repair endonuclease MutL [Zunongwangia profunda]|tara:strand:- start:1296 stop:3155 length:1860 start_codon:yes stop_codon:yes gene_type:complete